MELRTEFVTEIATPDGSGSGYMIAPGLVITALHVVLKTGTRQVPAQRACKVLLNGDVAAVNARAAQADPEWRLRERMEVWRAHAPPDQGWLPAEIIWPAPDSDPGDHDLALVRIRAGFESDTSRQDPRAGPAGKILRNHAMCQCVGYPEFRRRGKDEYTYYETSRFVAESDGLDDRGEPYDSRSPVRKLRVTNNTPNSPDGWQGLSGAAVVCNGQLVGVVHDRLDRTQANNVIGYYPLSRLPETSEFWSLSGLDPLSSQSAGSAARFELANHFRDLDRNPECDLFAGYVNTTMPENTRDLPAPARMAVLPGHAYDEIPHLADRLTKIMNQAFPKAGNAYASTISLNLGQAATPTDYRVKQLFADWAAQLGSDPGDLSNLSNQQRMEQVAHWLAAEDKPRIALIQHIDRRLADTCLAVIRALRDFLGDLPPSRPPCMVFLSVLGGTKCDTSDGFFDKQMWEDKIAAMDGMITNDFAAIDAEGRLCRMAPPSDVGGNDLDRWFAALAEMRWRPTAACAQRLEDVLPDYQYTPMRSVKRTLETELEMERT